MEEKNKKNINRRDFIKIVGISAATSQPYYTDVLLKVLPHQIVYREKGKYLLIK